MRPPVPYFGGKIRIADQIVGMMPAHQHYVEPFAGSLSVLLAKAPSAHETVNDLDEVLVTFWRVLRERPAELARACMLTPHSRAEFDACRRLDAEDELELARQVFVALTQGRSARLRRTGWRHYIDPAGCSVGMPGYLAGYVDRMAPAVERLQRVSLEHRPAEEIIAKYGTESSALLYVDPPYLGSTRANDRSYRVELISDAEHRALADQLLACRAAVMLSGYPSPLYDDLYAGWDRVEIATATGQGGAWDARTEVVWSNRSISEPHLLDLLEQGGGGLLVTLHLVLDLRWRPFSGALAVEGDQVDPMGTGDLLEGLPP